MVTRRHQIGEKRFRIFTSLYSYQHYPTGWACGHIVPILAGYHTGVTASTPGLIEIKS